MEGIMKTVVIATVFLSLLAGVAAAGPKLDILVARVTSDRATLDGLATFNPQSAKAKDAGLALLDEALTLFAAGGDDNIVRAFTALGKGLALLEKAAKKEVGGAFHDAVAQAAAQIWNAAVGVFSPGIAKAETSPEDALAKKLTPAMKLAVKQQFGKAVGKLAKVWRTLLVINPNP
jgi:hypothetical protein